ncbi:MAG TPA: DinB family protein [Mycobacterium sp.]|nr:DinB family protein [Mycobacterium sp.]
MLRVANDGAIDRAGMTADLERAHAEFHRLLADAERTDAWNKPTQGTRWNNEQLLLHMVFGYMLVLRLLFLVRLVSRLPEAVSRVHARILNAAATPFHPINYYGSCAAALYYNRRRMGAKLDRVIASINRKLAKESDEALHRGMHFPTGWDPFFTDYMTLEDVYRYPGKHFDFHARQLTLDA